MKIKFLTLLLIMGFGLLISCNNDDDKELESTAKISGFDWTECACCGGWIINIDGIDSDKRFSILPLNSDIDLENSVFPISVKLEWSKSDGYCENGIVIKSIELIE